MYELDLAPPTAGLLVRFSALTFNKQGQTGKLTGITCWQNRYLMLLVELGRRMFLWVENIALIIPHNEVQLQQVIDYVHLGRQLGPRLKSALGFDIFPAINTLLPQIPRLFGRKFATHQTGSDPYLVRYDVGKCLE